eukprot:COSAG02_NODE_8159_length_2685_cov_18.595901_1_plen_233_part_00
MVRRTRIARTVSRVSIRVLAPRPSADWRHGPAPIGATAQRRLAPRPSADWRHRPAPIGATAQRRLAPPPSADWRHGASLAPFVAVSADKSGNRHKRQQAHCPRVHCPRFRPITPYVATCMNCTYSRIFCPIVTGGSEEPTATDPWQFTNVNKQPDPQCVFFTTLVDRSSGEMICLSTPMSRLLGYLASTNRFWGSCIFKRTPPNMWLSVHSTVISHYSMTSWRFAQPIRLCK